MDALLNQAVTTINGFLWDYIIIALLIGAGFWFTCTTKFTQITQIPEMIRLLKAGVGKKTKGNEISSFQAFCISVASHVGVGNIAGIAIAVVLGGPGAVFWMWFIAVLGAATSFVECTLAQIYKEPLPGGGFHGGPAYYIRHGLKSPALAVGFAVLISVTYGLIYNSVQANTIAASLSTFGVSPEVSGLGVAILTAIAVFGGSARIAKFTEWLVPIMAGLYILTALFVVLMNITALPHVLATVVSSAFTYDAAGGGLMGAALMNGIKRGLFSNEAGEGSVPNAAATADVTHPARQGLVQAFGVFVDTFFICTSSAFIVLMSGNYTNGLTGIALIQHDLGMQLGSWAPGVLALFVFMFAFSSVIGNYVYGEINTLHLFKKRIYLHVFRIMVIAMVYFGSTASLSLVWNLADLFMAFMVLTNVTSILALGKQALLVLKDYKEQRARGVADPTFNRAILPKQDGIVWWDGTK